LLRPHHSGTTAAVSFSPRKLLILRREKVYVMHIVIWCAAHTYDSRLFFRHLHRHLLLLRCVTVFADADVDLYGRNTRRGVLAVDATADSL
jgi:hypothetical protein